MDFLLTILIFLFLTGMVFYIYLLLSQRRRRIEDRLRLENADPDDPKPMLFGSLAPALAAQIPISDDNRSALHRELRAAGFYRPSAVTEYAALRTLLTVPPVLAGGILALMVDQSFGLYCWIGGVVIGMLGFSLPRIYLYFRAKGRAYEIERGLPTVIDMLILCLSAGLNVFTSLQRVVRELYYAYPVLAYELDIVYRQAELRTMDFAVLQLAERTGLPNVRNLAIILSQSEALGTDALTTLREYADSLRISMRQRADEMANRAPFKLLFPSYLMALGAAVLIISPTVLEFAKFRRNNVMGNLRDNVPQQLEKKEAPRPSDASSAPVQ